MNPRTVVRVVGAALMVVGLVLLVATGAVASALGAQGGAQAVAGASDPTSLAFWFQLSFIRLFGMTLAGLGVILLWCGAHVGADQQRSLLKVMAGSLGALAVMAVGSQVAIWTSTAGWVLAGFLVSVAAACLMSVRPSVNSQAT
jgi:hypothetical protein